MTELEHMIASFKRVKELPSDKSGLIEIKVTRNVIHNLLSLLHELYHARQLINNWGTDDYDEFYTQMNHILGG